jgi:flavoprotein
MQPLGRKMFRNPNPCKHKVSKGETPWWVIPSDKKSDRQKVRVELNKEVSMSICGNCECVVDKTDGSILVTEDSQYLCGTCNECELCRKGLNEHTSDFENWVCEDCIEED